MSEKRQILYLDLINKDLDFIHNQIENASTPLETFQAYLLYVRQIGVHTVLALSSIADRVLPSDSPNDTNDESTKI
ncbi:MAG: hypothetical protein UU81_C0068G0005 [Microgenomates group bacterium GW2011_GWC1_41_8]|uniref:Uncharacterized protein n=2 Tax=Candidatus Roizmaniibacteriota TaxID=1752723 RepID=A0A0G0X9J7_9BACT|nr:MAG: hypothetical protein UU14_C0005G0062 [Candidatus Roizmanbacteria bacterium GW2011_GWB1_40_7]KKS21600.1 MAG: hypothetical protein UU78_C0035G0017 [Candidatus Roizmanbacteria bacterium GW2011_GWC2_41_7]KKS21783.1 MAG: hypothetical protein UU81_C0068G0005 [Microgenomates group bacterium GW2011_GWC1_41_8]